jgi:hypothetical protein
MKQTMTILSTLFAVLGFFVLICLGLANSITKYQWILACAVEIYLIFVSIVLFKTKPFE